MTFNINFVFSIVPKYPKLGGHGLAFTIMSTPQPMYCLANQYLGFPNFSSNAQFSNRILVVEFDAVQNLEFQDINDNHVRIYLTNLICNISERATYYFSNGIDINYNNVSIFLKSGDPFKAWIDYSSQKMLINVSICPLGMPRPHRPFHFIPHRPFFCLGGVHVHGFSTSTGLLTAFHYVHGWSFQIGRTTQDLDITQLQYIETRSNKVVHIKGFSIGIALASISLVILIITGVIHVLRSIKKWQRSLRRLGD